LHAWLAVTEIKCDTATVGNEGKICTEVPSALSGSDTFFPLNTVQQSPYASLMSEDFSCGASDLELSVIRDVVESSSDDVTFQGEATLIIRPWAETSFQTSVANFCSSHQLGKGSCASLSLAVADRLAPLAAATAAGLPPPQAMPSGAEPFIFLHHEKCAGTSLRTVIAKSAHTQGLHFHVPCFDPNTAEGPLIHFPPKSHPASCMSFNLDTVWSLSNILYR
jgi:hypothetical protein